MYDKNHLTNLLRGDRIFRFFADPNRRVSLMFGYKVKHFKH